MKKITAVFLIAIFSFHVPFSQALAASQSQSQKSNYELMNDYSFLIAPALATAVGYQKAGLKGAFAGLALGCIDEVAIKADYAKRHFLTSGLLGAAIVGSESVFKNAIGFLAGFFLATGKMNHVLDKAGTPISNAIVGTMYGQNGAIVGGVCGVIDEALLSYNVTASHYMSNGVYSFGAVAAVAPYMSWLASRMPVMSRFPVKDASAVALWAFLSSGAFQVQSKSPIQFAEDLYSLLSRLVDKETLDSLIEAQALALASSAVILAGLGKTLELYFQDLSAARNELGGANKKQAYAKSLAGIWTLVRFAPSYFGHNIVTGLINSLYAARLGQEANDGLRRQYVRGEVPLKLMAGKNESSMATQMSEQLQKVVGDGTAIISSALSTATGGAYQVMFLGASNGIALVVILDLYSRVIGIVSFSLAVWSSSYQTPIEGIDAKLKDLDSQLNSNAYSIVAADKTTLVAAKQKQLILERRRLESEQLLAAIMFGGWSSAQTVFDFAVRSGVMASMLANEQIQFGVRDLVSSAVGEVSSAMSWSNKNALRMQESQAKSTSLRRLLDRMDDQFKKTDKKVVYKSAVSDELAIVFEDVSVGVKGETQDQLLVNVPQLTLPKGIYSVRGPSGCGKSSFLAKVKGVEHTLAWGTGTITYLTKDGQIPLRRFATQEDYLTPQSTLLELIYAKAMNEISADEKARALALLNELSFHVATHSDGLENWLTNEHTFAAMLSGGQKKKLSLVSVLLAKPDILILDEIFAGMDKEVIAKAQRLIKQELADSIVLVVDHHATDNNSGGFYEKELYFADQKLHLLAL